jgi:hypothetical protein
MHSISSTYLEHILSEALGAGESCSYLVSQYPSHRNVVNCSVRSQYILLQEHLHSFHEMIALQYCDSYEFD